MARTDSTMTARGVESTQRERLQKSRAALHGLTAERLRAVLHYDENTGHFRKVGKISDPVGSLDPAGYRQIAVDGVLYKAHRLAVLYVTGEMPISALPVDHLNRRRDDNRWSNLRVATPTENVANQSRPGAYSRKPHNPELTIGAPTAAAVNLVRKGFAPAAAAEACGVTVATVRRACRAIGVTIQDGQPGAPQSALTTRGVELIQQGKPLRTVAGLLGLAPSTLVRACQRAGIVLPRGRPSKSA